VLCTCKIMLNMPETRQLIEIQDKYLMGQAGEACCLNIATLNKYIYQQWKELLNTKLTIKRIKYLLDDQVLNM
jgi:hypothetical protein